MDDHRPVDRVELQMLSKVKIPNETPSTTSSKTWWFEFQRGLTEEPGNKDVPIQVRRLRVACDNFS